MDSVAKEDEHDIEIVIEENEDDDTFVDSEVPRTPSRCKRRSNSVIDSIGFKEEYIYPEHFTPRRTKSQPAEQLSLDQGCSQTPGASGCLRPEWTSKRTDVTDAIMQSATSRDVEKPDSPPPESTARMPVDIEAYCYNMNHKNRGKCVVFNHETFDMGFDKRDGTNVDAKRIEATFSRLGFEVEVLDDLIYSEVTAKIKELSEEDHTDNDCICIFVLTHGLNNDVICARDVAYNSDIIWKSFSADKCNTLAGKPKLFFFQACRGNKLDGGITLFRTARMETDSCVTSYKIPTHADFLIAYSTVQGFFSWRDCEEGTWYIQCLCDALDKHADELDVISILTLTARKIAIEYASSNTDPEKEGQKQVPSLTSMLIRDLYLKPKQIQ